MSQPLFKYDVISDFCFVVLISLFLNESSSNLVYDVKIKRKENSKNICIAQKQIFFIICYKRKTFDSDFGHLLAKTS